MRTIATAAAVPIIILAGLSVIAGYAIGDVQQIPMRWNSNGSVTLYAPKWIGLSVVPAIGAITMTTLAVSGFAKTRNIKIRNIVICGSILVGCYIFYMILLRNYILNLSS